MKKVLCALAGQHGGKQLVAGVALSEDGDILGGCVMPQAQFEKLPIVMGAQEGRLELPDGTPDVFLLDQRTKLVASYMERYPEGFVIHWTWRPGEDHEFQTAQKRLLELAPSVVFDPWNPQPFWASKTEAAYLDESVQKGVPIE